MSSGSPTLGVVPKLLPVTGTYLVPLSIAHFLLAQNTVRLRLSTKTFHGDSSVTHSGNPRHPGEDPLYLATRTHANFLENVPLALLLSSAIELNGGSRSKLAVTLTALCAFRFAHWVGLTFATLIPRALGFYGTTATLLGMTAWVGTLCGGYWRQ